MQGLESVLRSAPTNTLVTCWGMVAATVMFLSTAVPRPLPGGEPRYISTIVGNGVGGFNGDGLPGRSTSLFLPQHGDFGPDGHFYFADWNSERIRRVVIGENVVEAVAGEGHLGEALDAPAMEIRLNHPTGVSFDRQEWIDTSVRLIERGVDWGVDEVAGDLLRRKSTGGFLARLGRWSMFDFIVGGYATVAAHEYGHKARVEELGRTATVIIRSFNSGSFRARGAFFSPRENLQVFSAGIEGARVIADRVEDRVYARGVASPGDLTTVFVGALASEAYLLTTLSESRLSSPERFLDGGRPGMPGRPETREYLRARRSRQITTSKKN